MSDNESTWQELLADEMVAHWLDGREIVWLPSVRLGRSVLTERLRREGAKDA